MNGVERDTGTLVRPQLARLDRQLPYVLQEYRSRQPSGNTKRILGCVQRQADWHPVELFCPGEPMALLQFVEFGNLRRLKLLDPSVRQEGVAEWTEDTRQ